MLFPIGLWAFSRGAGEAACKYPLQWPWEEIARGSSCGPNDIHLGVESSAFVQLWEERPAPTRDAHLRAFLALTLQ